MNWEYDVSCLMQGKGDQGRQADMGSEAGYSGTPADGFAAFQQANVNTRTLRTLDTDLVQTIY